MATYECSKCGMSVNATCGKCDAPLENDMLTLDDGSEVQISKCPNEHGKIKVSIVLWTGYDLYSLKKYGRKIILLSVIQRPVRDSKFCIKH